MNDAESAVIMDLGWPAGAPNTGLLSKLEAVAPPLETSATLPPECYWDSTIYSLEQRSVFARHWISVGRQEAWDSVGSYRSFDIGGAPIFVVRDQSGLRAFANSCRHRGAQLLSGEGQCRHIVCPLHRWTYQLDGRLKAAPHMTKASAFNKSEHGLVPVHVEQRAGFVFVNLSEEPEDIDQVLGDFLSVHQGWGIGELRQVQRKALDLACNWKLFLEIFNEYYHLHAVHPDSINERYKPPFPCDEVHGQYTTQFGEVEGNPALLEGDQAQSLPVIASLAERERAGVRYTWIFPNLTFAASRDSVWILEAYPLGPDKTRGIITVCFPESTISAPDFQEKVEHYLDRFKRAMAEDVGALENQHRGLKSPLARQGRFCTTFEPSVANFAFWYAGVMTAALR